MNHKERLLEGAKRCLYEKGWARTSARDIVAASGTNLGSIGYHFGSKDALLTAAMMDGFEEFGADLEEILSAGTDGSPIDRLEAIWTKLIESFETHRHVWMASFDAFVQAEHSPEVRKILAAGYEAARPNLASRLFGVNPSEVDERDARTVGSFLIALQAGLAAQWLLDPERSPSGRDVADALRRISAFLDESRTAD